jgi:hypothetical protein
MNKNPAPGTNPDNTNCGVQFTVNVLPGQFHCSRPPYHQGPHYDGYRGYWWGFTDPEEDPITQQVWNYRRNTETLAARKAENRRKRRKLWNQIKGRA